MYIPRLVFLVPPDSLPVHRVGRAWARPIPWDAPGIVHLELRVTTSDVE